MFRVLGCKRLYPDLKAALRVAGLPDAALLTFPARCGLPPLAPDKISGHGQVILVGGLCLSRIEPAPPDMTVCIQNQCFYHFCPRSLVDHLQQEGGYLMTPGWLANWEDQIKDWGFDRKTAQTFFRDSAHELILLDTGVCPGSRGTLDEMAGYLGMASRVIPLGLDHLALVLEKAFLSQNYITACRKKEAAEKQAADHALVQDMLNRLPETVEETDVIDALKELFIVLTAPESITYLPWEQLSLPDGRDGLPAGFIEDEKELHRIDQDATGFYLKVSGNQSMIGLLSLKRLAFPEHMTHYLNIALNVSGIFGLAVAHVRMVKKLVDASLAAGKAELATEMLHNVGNVLNSVNIAAEQIRQGLSQFSGEKIMAVADLIKTQGDGPYEFLSKDPRGIKLPLFLEKLGKKILSEKTTLIREVDAQLHKIKIIADIISSQQELAGCRPIKVRADIPEVVEESLKILDSRLKTHAVQVDRAFHPVPRILSQRGKLLQILLNILSNAVDALADNSPGNRKIIIHIRPKQQRRIVISIADNGCGIPRENLTQIFSYGFSTKKEGHGFGLHNAANLAAQLKGHLTATSPGPKKGSTFSLTLSDLPAIKGHKKERSHGQQTHSHY